MAVSTKRKNSLKSKSNSKTRKQFKSIRKNRIMTRQIAGFKFRFTKPPPPLRVVPTNTF